MTSSLVSSTGTIRPMLRLALPVLVTNLLHVLVEHVDTWLAGNYLIEQGDAPMAAIGLVRYLMWFVFTLFTVLSIGAMALVARMVGGGNLPAARRATNQALSVGIILSLIFMFAGWYLVEPLVALLQLEGEAARLAVRYLLFVLPVLPAIMIEEVGVACLRGAGDMVSGLIAMVVVNIVNISVSSCLLLGAGPFPELGWSGLAIGTLCGRVVGAIVILVLLLRGRAGLGLSLAQLRPDWHLIRRMLRIGIPGGLDAVTVVSCHMWYVSIINQLGARAAAAHGVGVSIEALAYMPGAAFQAAAATMAGQFLGAQLPERAARSVLVALAAGTAFMTGVGVLFYFGSEPLAEFFLGARESSVVPLAARLLRIVAFTMPALATTMILAGGLRGAGDTRTPLLVTLTGFLTTRIPLAYFFAHEGVILAGADWEITGLGWGVPGAWYAMVIDTFVRCLLITLRFLQGGWKRIVV